MKFTAPVKRSGITRLSTPCYSPPTADHAKSSRVTTLSTSSPSVSVVTAIPDGHETTAGAEETPPAPTTPTVTRNQQTQTANSKPVRGSDTPAVRSRLISHSNSHWRHRVVAVCQRLEQTVQETELILMRVASTTTAAQPRLAGPDSVMVWLDKPRHPLTDPCTPTPAQMLDAVQRYRSACMAALVELHHILNNALLDVTMSSTRSDPQHTHHHHGDGCSENDNKEDMRLAYPVAGTVTGTASAGSHAAELAQLQRRYCTLEDHLSDVLAAQAAYVNEVAARQHQRERDGVMGEYMWATRLLVEQEAAERVHLARLYAYVSSSIRGSRGGSVTCSGHEGAVTAATALSPAPEGAPAATTTITSAAQVRTHRPSAQDDAAVARLMAEKEALLVELSQQSSRTQSLLSAQMRDVQAANERALAQMAARHAAEKNVWASRLAEAREEVDTLRRQCAESQQRLDHAQMQRREAQQYASLSEAGLRQQLKDTAKRMWQLQLANDHLDAKMRMLQRELEEARGSTSPTQRRTPSTSPPPSQHQLQQGAADRSQQDNEGNANHERCGTATTISAPALIGVPAAARMSRATTTPPPSGTPRSARNSVPLRSIPRLPDPPLRRRSLDDVRRDDPRWQRTSDSHVDDEATVSPSVWLAYDERNLLSGTTPTRSERPSYTDRTRDMPASANTRTSVTHAWGDARFSWTTTDTTSMTRRSSALQAFPVWTSASAKRTAAAGEGVVSPNPHRGDAAVNVSYMSEGSPTGHVSVGTPSLVSATAVAAAATTVGDRNDISSKVSDALQQLRGAPARRQLSLDRTPATIPPHPVSVDSHGDSLSAASAVSVGVEEEVPLTYRDDGDEDDEAVEETGEASEEQQNYHLTYHCPHEQPVPPRPSGRRKAVSASAVPSSRSSPSPHVAPLASSTPPSSRTHVNSDLEDDDDNVCPPLTAPHGAAAVTTSHSNSSTITKRSDTGEDNDDGDYEEGEEGGDSIATLTPSARGRLENVRREILHHMELLEADVQAVTARHDAAQRRRRRERDMIRVNAASLHSSPAAEQTNQTVGGGAGDTSDVDRALEQLHIAQQEDDDHLSQYYTDVNQKRGELARCLRVVEEKLAPQ
jgi:hypothetical protein